jgi:hypothetical protein
LCVERDGDGECGGGYHRADCEVKHDIGKRGMPQGGTFQRLFGWSSAQSK